MTSVQETITIYVVNVYKIFEKKYCPGQYMPGHVNYHTAQHDPTTEVRDTIIIFKNLTR